MQNAGIENRRFNAEPQEFSKISRQKTRQILGIVLGVILLIAAFFFGNLQDENWYNKSDRDMYGMLKVCCIICGLLEVVISPIVLYEFSKTENKLSSTYITLRADKIEGIHFNNPAAGVPFEITYADVIEATVLPDDPMTNKGNNIRIRALSGTYSCYAIEQKAIVVKLINERKAKYDERVSVNNAKQVSVPLMFSGKAEKYCMYCGTGLSRDASFCYNCGKGQK